MDAVRHQRREGNDLAFDHALDYLNVPVLAPGWVARYPLHPDHKKDLEPLLDEVRAWLSRKSVAEELAEVIHAVRPGVRHALLPCLEIAEAVIAAGYEKREGE